MEVLECHAKKLELYSIYVWDLIQNWEGSKKKKKKENTTTTNNNQA